MATTKSTATESFVSQYRPYQNLPALAGLGSFAQAVQPGLSVEESVSRLKRHHYLLRRLHHAFIARLTSEPIYELKMAFSYHAYLCAEHVTALRQRVGEMREPPLGLDRVPHPALEVLGDEILSAADTGELLLGIYEIALPHLVRELGDHQTSTHILADQPTRRLCRGALLELEEMLEWGRSAIACLVKPEDRAGAAAWLNHLRLCAEMSRQDSNAAPARLRSAQPFVFDPRPRRDDRFPDPYNMGVNAEVFLYDPAQPADAKVLMMFYKRLREIDVPEMMASIITETPDKPWAYYRDMTRQLWDEARHAMMGEVGFVSAGIDWPRQVMVNFTWSLGLNTQLTPKERHAVLYFIEQGLMPKHGKRHEWEVSLMAQNALAATFQDFDWADEVLHARVGRDWYVSEMPSAREAVEYGDRCWSKVLTNWESWRAQGLTQHRNWWPGTYRAYCEACGKEPDPAVLAYDKTYASTRADLKEVTGSA
jgi:hypothetical protein